MRKVSVLFVCMGNICRSPMGEGAFRRAVADAELDDHFHIDSAGTIGFHAGNPPDRRMMATARRGGIDISDQRSRKVRASDFTEFDYIVAMDHENHEDLMRACPPGEDHRIHMFLPFAPDLDAVEMPDPYYGGDEGFDYVFNAAIKASDGLLDAIKKSHF